MEENNKALLERNLKELIESGYTDVRGVTNLNKILQSKKYILLTTFIMEIFVVIDPDRIIDIKTSEIINYNDQCIKRYHLYFEKNFSFVTGAKSVGMYRLRQWAVDNSRYDLLLRIGEDV